MNNKSVKRTNLIFFFMVLFYLASSLFLSIISARVEISLVVTLISGELIILLPGLIFALLFRMPVSDWFPVRKVKLSTIGFTILLSFLLLPILYFFNLLSQLFEKNVAVDLFADLESIPYFLIFLIVGLFGPLCEELAFRGIIFSGFKKSGRIFGAALLSAALFGLFHMNLNQLGYAAILGFASAMLVEATQSIIPSIIMHVIVNSYNVMQMVIADKTTELMGSDFTDIAEAQELVSNNDLLFFAGALVVPMVIATTLAVVVYIAILNREGTKEHILSILPSKGHSHNQGNRLLTVYGILGIIFCLIITFVGEYFKSIF